MRSRFLALSLGALVVAAPAAAQPSAPHVLRAVMDRLAADVTEVEDYTFTLVHAGGVRVPVYVHRTGQSWAVALPPTRLDGVARMAVFWPGLLDPSASLGMHEARYLRDETVDGRRTQVLDALLGANPGAGLDSARVLVDPATQRVVRVVVAASGLPETSGPAPGDGAGMNIVVDAGPAREMDGGLPLPEWVRVRMRLELPDLPADQREAMLANFRQARAQLRDSTDPGAREMLVMADAYVQMFSPDGMDMRLRVEDVAVNPGPPAWFTGTDDEGSR